MGTQSLLARLIPVRFRKSVPVVNHVLLHGVIGMGGPGRQALTLKSVNAMLERAFKPKGLAAVAISINSPGGSPVQSRLIHARIRELANKHRKRVLVFVEDVAASGGYMIALAGDEIIADEMAVVGSTGVVSAGFGFEEAIRKPGVERRVHTSGENKAILDPFQPEKPEDVEHLKRLQREIHEGFIAMVKDARKGKLADDPTLFTGLFWTGAKGRELGLVDTCGLIGNVITERYGEKAQLKLVHGKRSFLGRAQPGVTGMASAAGEAFAAALPGAAFAAIEERALWQRYGY